LSLPLRANTRRQSITWSARLSSIGGMMTPSALALATLSAQTIEKLAKLLPAAASLGNPVDVAGGTDADPSVFAACAKALLEDTNVDGVLITGRFGGYGVRFAAALSQIELVATEVIGELAKQSAKARADSQPLRRPEGKRNAATAFALENVQREHVPLKPVWG
jgi:hypothetical protein